MNRISFPLKLQMKRPEVADLHQGLALLGLPTVTSAERTAQRFGASTRAAVLSFQAARKLPATGEVDAATAAAINTELVAQGALAPPPGGIEAPAPSVTTPFTIQGEVVKPDGTPIPNQIVQAYDRALCEWRRLGDVEAIVRTNDLGKYEITYEPAQLKQWGKTRADLKVEVRAPDTTGAVLAESPLILRARPHETVNFSIGSQRYRGPDEFTRLEKALAPLLAGHDADLSCLLTPDVLILAREASLAISKVAHYVKARRWSASFGLPTALFYGLLRGGEATRIDALFARPLARLWARLEEARSRNLIGLVLSPGLRGQVAQAQQSYLAKPEHPYAQLLETTALSADKKSTFTRRLTTGDTSGDELWQALQADDGFSTDEVATLQETFELQAVVGDNTSLNVALRGTLAVRVAREVAGFSREHWRNTVLNISTVEFPDEVLPDGSPAERRAAYAQMLYREAERRYPTASLAGQMARDAQWADHPLLGFFSAHPTFEFTDQRALQFLRAQPDALQGLPPSAGDDLLRIEQLFHLTPGEDKLAVIQPMWNAGLRAAPQLASLGRAGLARRLAGTVDTKAVHRLYRKAVHVTSLALSVYLRFNPGLNRLSLATLRLPQAPDAQETTQALARSAIALPEWQELFGSPDACECSHCESALSPAAYLVSIMAFLERAVDSAGHNALDELLARRPDLGTLQLSCENTETLVPHIDLAIEILESIVASTNGQTLSATDIGPTTWDADLLAAQPEYLRTAAYDIVRLAAYPLRSLPFDLWAEEGWRYLARMGIAREELMEAMPAMPGVGALQRATAALGMSRFEREVIAHPKLAAAALAPMWGYDSAAKFAAAKLATVANLLTRAGIDYDTLLRLLNTRYLNPGRSISIRFEGTPCSVDGAVLIDAAGIELTGVPLRTLLDRLHRFLRLQARLDCDEYALDTLVQALGANDFDAPHFFEKLADVQALRQDLRVGLADLGHWWAATLDTFVFEEALASQYEAIYLDEARFPDTHTGTGVDLRNAVFALRADRADLAITSSADASLSPWLAESDGATPPSYTVQADYGAYIQSATRLTGDDLLLLATAVLPKDAGTGHVALDLANASLLYRLATFVRASKLSVEDFIRLVALTGEMPLHTPSVDASPHDTQGFIEDLADIRASGYAIEQLAYLHLHEADAVAALAPGAETADVWLQSMVDSFRGVLRLDDAALTDALKASLTQSIGSTLGLDPAALDALLFTHRLPLGDELLTHVIVAANQGSTDLPVPAVEFPTLFDQLNKFGLAWNGLKLDLGFLPFLLDTGPGLGWADIATLPTTAPSTVAFEPWRRLVAAAALQNSTFTLEESLFVLIEQATAESADPASFVLDDFLAQLSAWTTWPLADISYLTGATGFNLVMPAAMKDERALLEMKRVFDLIRTSGVSVAQAHSWTIEELGFVQTQAIKQGLSPAFAPERWLDVLGTIQDELRTLKRDALLGHALTRLDMKDAEAFYAQYLIDPAMSPADRTSRIVLAHSAVQLFVQRILLNLESCQFEKVDATAWQWQQNYRVWEAARRVFLTPENWLEPDWRDDKSAFFRELEDALDQEDVTAESAERIYRDYLLKVDQVSRLEILGSYEESWTVGDTDTVHLHVVGRTQEVPAAYFYRRLEDRAHWTPWERIQIDMTGDHLIPVAFNGKLYLFWPEFKVTESDAPSAAEQARDEVAAAQQDIADIQNEIDAKTREIKETKDPVELASLLGDLGGLVGDLSVAQAAYDDLVEEDGSVQVDPDIPEPYRYEVELGMAWCTYGPSGTSPKQSARETLTYGTNVEPEWHHFSGWVTGDNILRIAVRTTHSAEPDIGYFYLDNVNGELHASEYLSGAPVGDVSVAGAMQRFQALELVYFSGGEPRLELNIAGTPWLGELLTETTSATTRALDTNVDLADMTPPRVPQVRTLLSTLTDGYGRVHYLHQLGLGGNATAPFFFSTNLGCYFVQQVTVLALPLLQTTGERAAQIPARSTAARASSRMATFEANPHYQSNGTQIIDRGLGNAAGATLQSSTSLVNSILVDDQVPTELAGADLLDTETKYRFTRFADPNTSLFLRQVSRHGVAGLLSPDPSDDDDSETLYRQLLPLDTFDFADSYAPNADWVAAPYPTGKIDFDDGSPSAWSNWELFFHIPMTIATRLMRNERYAEARLWMQHIFDPTAADETGPEGFWKIKPFYEEQQGGALQSLDTLLTAGSTAYEQQVEAWGADPFQPHAIARLRISAYMQAVVMRYLSALISEADMLFRRDTREYIDRARQLYVMASSILGERPTLLPAQEVSTMTPNLLLNRFRFEWNGLPGGNPLDALTSWLSASSPGASTTPKRSMGLAGGALTVDASAASGGLAASFGAAGHAITLGSASGVDTLLLMCLPHNDVLYGYWDQVADRLFKIRHSMNLSGQVRQLALFAPPIDPALLVRAAAAGLDIEAVLSGLFAPRSNYRFAFMLQKALELCGEARNLGQMLLAALEKRDAEQLGLLRSTHEVGLLAAVRALKKKSVDEADASLSGLMKSRDAAQFRVEYYSGLERVSAGEQKSLDALEKGRVFQIAAEVSETLASLSNLAPNVSVTIAAVPSTSISFGGSNLGAAAQAIASSARALANAKTYESSKASTMAAYSRRSRDWRFQADLAGREVEQLDQQILAAEIRRQIAETDLANHDKQIEQAKQVEDFLKLKFSNQQLYGWMVSRLASVHFQAYQMAYQTALQAQSAFAQELGPEQTGADFIKPDNWDSLKKGLVAGELLQVQLRQMETAHLAANKRELEITKQISLFQLDAAALLALRATGACEFHVPDVWFALDYPGHYFRRIKSVSLTIPCVIGPYANVSATLSLVDSWTRHSSDFADSNQPENDTLDAPQTAIATSTAMRDGGMFELSFNDARYLPFEGVGAISRWRLELPSTLRPFDYATISDVVMQMSYTARDGGAEFKAAVESGLVAALNQLAAPGSGGTMSRLISLRHDFPDAWNQLMSTSVDAPRACSLQLTKQLLPSFLDHAWSVADDSAAATPLGLTVVGLTAYLGPTGELPPSAQDITMNGRPQVAAFGSPSFDLLSAAGALSGTTLDNSTTIDCALTLEGPAPSADDWRDLYLIMEYEVA